MYNSSNVSVNEKGHLTFAGMDTVDLAKEYGTPAYIMDEERIRERCRIYRNAMTEHFGEGSMPLFASKSLSVKRIYEIMAEEGMGIDIVSSGELYTALKAGFDLSKAYFHGNNKTDFDIKYGIENGIGHFVCDNADELRAINEIAGANRIKQNILLRITPGIDPHTLAAINTGKVDSKFGAAIETGQADELVALALSLENLVLDGYHCHIGSQIFEYEPFVDAATIMLTFMRDMKVKYGFEAQIINLGGGMGVKYVNTDPEINYASNIAGIATLCKKICGDLGLNQPKFLLEPGRSIVADSGITLYTVGGVKEIPGFKNYVSIDGGMPDNPRYALYQSTYDAVVANKASLPADYECTLAGRCCESGDLIGEGMMLTKPVRGDTVAVFVTGAYNYAMASHYNRIPKAPIIMVNKNGSYIAVKRETFEDLCKNEI